MTTAYGYDDTNLSLIPSDAEYVFYYVDGDYKETSTVAAKFPKAHLIGIAVDSADAADVLDVETGDASIADVFYWLKARLATSWAAKPTKAPAIYISASDIDSLMLTMNANGFVHGRDYVLWSAHYTGTAHLCGPDTCKECATACDATQYTDSADGKSLDESELGPSFLATASSSATTTATKPAAEPGTVTFTCGGSKITFTLGREYTFTLT